MGTLQNLETGARIALRSRHRIGRSRSNHTKLTDADVSGEHALLSWDDGWELRDLGSRNGSRVRDAQLAPGQRSRLDEGDAIGFGGVTFVLVSAAAPTGAAQSGELWVEGEGDVLAVPSLDEPLALYRYDTSAGWVDDDENPVDDGATVQLGGETWTLDLPELEDLAPTRELGSSERTLSNTSLHFGVSGDEEYVELTVTTGGEAVQLSPRAHHYVLLTLARARIKDAADGEAESAAGWLHTEDLQRMLRSTRNQIYIAAHRTKKELDALGIVDAAEVVQRRKTSQQLRIGVKALSESGI